MALVNSRLKAIQFSKEFKRAQISLADINLFKANEFRSYVYHVGPFSLYNILPQQIFEHFMVYTAFVRLLTKNNLSNQDIMDSYRLIEAFSKEWQAIYGIERMSYK